MDDAVALGLEFAQQFRQRQRGGRLDVVQQQDALALLVEAGDRAAHHFGGADVPPVVGDDVGAPGHQTAGLQIGFDLVAPQESRDTEERCDGAVVCRRGRDRNDALFDFVLHGVERRAIEAEQMVLAVGADGVAFGEDAAGEVRIAAGHAADQEIVGLHAMLGQHVEHAIGVGRQRAVIEGQHDLLVLERQRTGVLHRADAGEFARVDRQHPAGAERIRIAGAVGGARLRGRERDEHQYDHTNCAPKHQVPIRQCAGCDFPSCTTRTLASGVDNTAARRQISAVIFNARAKD